MIYILKAEQILDTIDSIKPGDRISWTLYNGTNGNDAKLAESYVNTFFRTGKIFPIQALKKGLDIHAVEYSFDDDNKTHIVKIEGIVKDQMMSM